MIALGPLVLVLLVIVVVFATKSIRRSQSTPSGAPGGPAVAPGATEDVDALLSKWTAAGLITPVESQAIHAFEHGAPGGVATTVALKTAAPAPTPEEELTIITTPRIPIVAEALGYLGGILAIVGVGFIVGKYWKDMPTAGRLLVAGGVSGVALFTGILVHEHTDAAFARLRGFLWLVATGGAGLFTTSLVRDAFGVERTNTVVLVTAAVVTTVSVALWQWRSERFLQEITALVGAVVTVGAAVNIAEHLAITGLAVWVAGGLLLAVGLRHRVPNPVLAEFIGALSTIVGAILVVNDWQGFGFLLGVATAVAIIGLALVPGLAAGVGEQITCGAIGAIALLQFVPPTIGYWANAGSAGTGFTMWVIGAGLIAVGMRTRIRLPLLVEGAGAVACIGGAALTWSQLHGFAPLFGIATAVALIALGMLPGQVICSLIGSVGLLINVPWAISWFFPGQNRAPLLISVTGVLIILVALLLVRRGSRMRGHPA
ncbi:MAG: hypothetical protein ACOYNI_09350 [Acidimicrobiia bacterium]